MSAALNSRGERILLDFYAGADRFAAYMGEAPIARAQPVTQCARPLAPSRWPDCPLCSRDVNGCECDPDDYAAALLAQRRAA